MLIAVQAGNSEASAALIHAYTVGAFVLGLLASSIGIELGLRRGVPRVLTLAASGAHRLRHRARPRHARNLSCAVMQLHQAAGGGRLPLSQPANRSRRRGW